MREIRQSGSEGGVAPTRHPYPYHLATTERRIYAAAKNCVVRPARDGLRVHGPNAR